MMSAGMTGYLIRNRLTFRHSGLRHAGQSVDLGEDGDHRTVARSRARDKSGRNPGDARFDLEAGFL